MTEPSMDQAVTAGAWLKQQREHAQVTLEGLCVALKVQPHRLIALESDDWESLPDTLFIRSLALGICRHLRADEKVLLPLLPAPPQRDLKVGLSDLPSIPFNPNRWSGPMLFFSHRWSNQLLYTAGVLAAVFLFAFLAWQWSSDVDSPDPKPAAVPQVATENAAAVITPTTQANDTDQIDGNANLKAPQDTSVMVKAEVPQPSPLVAKPHMVITPVVPQALKQNSENSAPLPTKP
jgi:cytoskeleton protein RodZ